MGGNVSKTVLTSIVEASTVVNTEVLTRVANTTNSNANISQNINVVLAGDSRFGCDGQYAASNSANVVIKGIADTEAEILNDVATEISTNVINEAAAVLEQLAEASFAPKGKNYTETLIDVYTEIQEEVNNSITNSISSVVVNTGNTSQSITFTLRERAVFAIGGACSFNNELAMAIVAENAVNAFVDNMLETEAVNEIVQEIDANISQISKGMNLGAIIALVAIVLVTAIVVAIVIKMLKSKKTKKAAGKTIAGAVKNKVASGATDGTGW